MIFQVIGPIQQPAPINAFQPVDQGGLGQLINVFLQVIVVGAMIYALFNFVMAGYAFMSAGDDPKKVAGAWSKIWQTALGLAVAAGAFALAAIFSWLIFGDPDFLLRPTLPTI